MIPKEQFKTIIDNTPLISIDFIVRNQDNKILLGRRVNKPAKDFLFTIGGRIFKNEKIEDAKQRIIKEEINLDTNDLIKDFDYKPDTKLSDGIGEFVDWYKEFYGEKQ